MVAGVGKNQAPRLRGKLPDAVPKVAIQRDQTRRYVRHRNDSGSFDKLFEPGGKGCVQLVLKQEKRIQARGIAVCYDPWCSFRLWCDRVCRKVHS